MKLLTILVSLLLLFYKSFISIKSFVINVYLCLPAVTKPTSSSFEPPRRPSNPAPSRASIPPPKPAPPRPTPPAASNENDERNTSSADVNAEGAMPDIAQPEVDLLNMLPRSNNNNIPPKEASFDLLGAFETSEAQGNNAMPDLLSESKAKPQGLEDIFGSFGQPNNTNTSNLPDLGNFNAGNSTASSNNMNFDPFGNDATFVGNASVLRPTSTETSPSQAKQPPSQANVPPANKDPFGDLGNLASGLNLNWGSQTGTSPQTTQFSSPTHQFGGFVPNVNTTQPSPNTQQARSPMENQAPLRPDYSRSHFETKPKQNGANASANAAPSASGGDIFADILGQQGYSFATKPQGGTRSINEMRKEELVKDMDPDKLKIMEWVCLYSSVCFMLHTYSERFEIFSTDGRKEKQYSSTSVLHAHGSMDRCQMAKV